MTLSFEANLISRRIDAHFRCHTLNVHDRKICDLAISTEIDDFVVSLSIPNKLTFTGLGDRWQEIVESEARYTLTYILSHDIAYGTPEILDSEARKIVNEFLALFGNNPRFFSNGSFNRKTQGWSGHGVVTNWTYETGVVVVGTEKIGLLWCYDED